MFGRKRFLRVKTGLIQCAAPLVLFVAAAPAAHALTWPAAGCNSTLQACIDAAAPGDTVSIAYNGTAYVTAIDESIVIGKSLTLKASDETDAVFTSGHTITVQSPASGATSVTLQRLTLLNGRVVIDHNSDAASSYTVSQLTIKETNATLSECAIEFNDLGTGSPQFTLGDTRLETRIPRVGLKSGVCAAGHGGAWTVNLFRNHLRSENGSLLRVVAITGANSGNITLEGNQVLGNGFSSGINISQNVGSASNTLIVQNNSVVGQRAPGSSEGAINITTTNGDVHVVNNTLVDNTRGLSLQRFAVDGSVGRVANNLVAFNSESGLNVESFASNDYNLVYANGFSGYVPGPHTVVADPQLRSLQNPRPKKFSPAQDAGNSADVSAFLGIAFDADGERRFSDAGVDIGAFEYNDDYAVVQTANAGNTVANTTSIDALSGLLSVNEFLLVTPHDGTADAAEAGANLGVYEDNSFASHWAIFREDGGDLSTGRRYSVLAPYDGRTRYVHTSGLADVVNAFTRLDNAELNGSPTAIAFVQHNWNPGGSGSTYHDHPVGLSYSAPNWYIGNQDSADMAAGVSFNVVIAPLGSPNAFIAPVPAAGYCCITLYHPLLDGNACAAPIVTRNNRASALSDNSALRVHYDRGHGSGSSGHWDVRTVSGMFVANTAFNVMVQGAQANACRDDVIFADGADG